MYDSFLYMLMSWYHLFGHFNLCFYLFFSYIFLIFNIKKFVKLSCLMNSDIMTVSLYERVNFCYI